MHNSTMFQFIKYKTLILNIFLGFFLCFFLFNSWIDFESCCWFDLAVTKIYLIFLFIRITFDGAARSKRTIYLSLADSSSFLAPPMGMAALTLKTIRERNYFSDRWHGMSRLTCRWFPWFYFSLNLSIDRCSACSFRRLSGGWTLRCMLWGRERRRRKYEIASVRFGWRGCREGKSSSRREFQVLTLKTSITCVIARSTLTTVLKIILRRRELLQRAVSSNRNFLHHLQVNCQNNDPIRSNSSRWFYANAIDTPPRSPRKCNLHKMTTVIPLKMAPM